MLSRVFRERDSAHQFHCKIRLAILVTTRLVDRSDSAMSKARQRLRFALEESDAILVDMSPASDDFKGNDAIGVLLPCFVDHPHSAFTESPNDLIGSDPLGNGSVGRLSCRRDCDPPGREFRRSEEAAFTSSEMRLELGCTLIEGIEDVIFGPLAIHSHVSPAAVFVYHSNLPRFMIARRQQKTRFTSAWRGLVTAREKKS